jgi:hypothetical protein
VSSSTFDYKQYDQRIPDDSPEVARIMRERGVGRRRATHLARKQRAESIDVSDVSLSQKEQVLLAVVNHKPKNSIELQRVMRLNGSTIDGHDTAKMLWACQKMGWVTFKERKAGGSQMAGIYGIKVTDKGYSAASGRDAAQAGPAVVDAIITDDVPEGFRKPKEQAVIEKAAEVVAEAVTIAKERYPLITDILLRAAKAERLNSAARILEQAGEEDLALQVMGKTEFTPLEKEVIDMCGNWEKED